MNTNTVVSFQGGTGRNQITSQTLAATTETEFKVITDTSGTTAIAVLAIPQQTDIKGSGNPINPNLNASLLGQSDGRPQFITRPGFTSTSFDGGRPFVVRILGLATPASNAGNTLTIKIYQGTTKSGQLVASTGAVPEATTTTATNFLVQAELFWDSTSQIINGQYCFNLAGTSGTVYGTWAAVASAPSTVTLANLKFCASAQWGNAAGGVVAISEFSIAQI